MELDKRQGDLFLDLLQGGKPEPYLNFRSKLDAMDPERRSQFDQEGNLVESKEAVECRREQSSG